MRDEEETTVQEESAGREEQVDARAAEMVAVRELALKAHPDAVPELVGGASVAEVMASLEPARAAYRRIAEAAVGRAQAPVVPPVPPVVPAGDAPRFVVDVDRLPAAEKIRRGLAARR